MRATFQTISRPRTSGIPDKTKARRLGSVAYRSIVVVSRDLARLIKAHAYTPHTAPRVAAIFVLSLPYATPGVRFFVYR